MTKRNTKWRPIEEMDKEDVVRELEDIVTMINAEAENIQYELYYDPIGYNLYDYEEEFKNYDTSNGKMIATLEIAEKAIQVRLNNLPVLIEKSNNDIRKYNLQLYDLCKVLSGFKSDVALKLEQIRSE